AGRGDRAARLGAAAGDEGLVDLEDLRPAAGAHLRPAAGAGAARIHERRGDVARVAHPEVAAAKGVAGLEDARHRLRLAEVHPIGGLQVLDDVAAVLEINARVPARDQRIVGADGAVHRPAHEDLAEAQLHLTFHTGGVAPVDTGTHTGILANAQGRW